MAFWKKKEKPLAEDGWLIVGLGNPGPKYELTRHNVGQMVTNLVAEEIDVTFKSHKTNNQLANGKQNLSGPQLILIKPNSFMNLSGGPTAAAMNYFNVPSSKVIVLHDELDIPFGQVKLKKGGGHGGHNGLRDITKSLNTPDFLRVRIGIGRPPGRQNPADFVLSPFNSSEKKELDLLLENAKDAVLRIISDGFLHAQQEIHARSKA